MTTSVSVISLAADHDRREAFARQAAAARIDWRFFDACTSVPPPLSYDASEALVSFGRRLTPGELGCYASHYSVWRGLLESEHDQLIVLEDDTLVDWAFLRRLVEIDFAAQGIQYLKLFSRLAAPFKSLRYEYIEASRSLIRYTGPALGTQAYVVTREGAARLVEHCREVRRPIDHEMERAWAHGLPIYAVYPFPVIELSSPSRIGDQRNDAAAEGDWALRGRRVASRLVEKARRTVALFAREPELSLS